MSIAHLAPREPGQASDWVQRWSHLAKPAGTVLDVACGHGRHMAWFAQRGFQVTGIDQSLDAGRDASQFGKAIQADIENGPWPLLQAGLPLQFDVVVVTNYLWRALFPTLLQSLAPGGLLIYETFAQGNETVGKPARPDFLLQPAELLTRCQGLQIVAYENGFLNQPERFVQRIVALAPAGSTDVEQAPPRYPLSLK